MGWSKSARIKTLLVIDTVFLFIELITGYAVGSLALVADSFHMLNDVMSLIVALYALKLAENSTRSNKYSYGWQRAEILGALVNGVFLLALCFSIFLEAVQRMFEAPEVKSPKIVVVVGSLGLLSNIVGLFLFHEHGHSHGGGGHSHGGHSHEAKAEEGHSTRTRAISSSSSAKAKAKKLKNTIGNGSSSSAGQANERSPLLGSPSNRDEESEFPALPGRDTPTTNRLTIGGSETPFSLSSENEDDDDYVPDGLDELLVHPARTREAIVRQAYDAGFGASSSASPRNTNGDGGFSSSSLSSNHRRTQSFQSMNNNGGGNRRGRSRTESTSKAAPTMGSNGRERSASRGSAAAHGHNDEHDHDHADDEDEHDHDREHDQEGHEHDHDHDEEDDGHGHGHSHGNMNMRGVFLHVLGDALGNVGVIAAGLIIWLTRSPYRFYSDPLISLVITIIIFSSALPLVRSASFILLQGTPAHVPLEKVRHAILKIPNVISVHDLHIWSLSESKLVASMHILVKSHTEFAACSQSVRKVLHRFGVHSTTIQPELLDMTSPTTQNAVATIMSRQGSMERLNGSNGGPGNLVIIDGDDDDGVGCMAQCVEDSCIDSSCCPPNSLQAAIVATNKTSNPNLKAGIPSASGSVSGNSNGNSNGKNGGGASYASVAAP